MEPVNSYIICTSPRSGSTLLCHLLKATGQGGAPDSHFHDPSLPAWLAEYDLDAASSAAPQAALRAIFEAAMKRGRAGAEMFGLRLQRHSVAFFLKQLAVLHPEPVTDKARMEAVFGCTAFIYLSRESKLDQAISYVKAQQSGLWHRAPDGTEIERLAAHRDPVYDRAVLARQIAQFEANETAWEDWFAQEGIAPLRVTYEALAADPLAVLAGVLTHLRLPVALADGLEIPVARLADATNARWAARYRAERG